MHAIVTTSPSGRRLSRATLAGIRLLVFAACLTTVAKGQGIPEDARLDSELTTLDAPETGRALYYLGVALHPEPWSMNDATGIGDALSQGASGYQHRDIILSNAPSPYPLATPETIAAALAAIGAHLHDGDLAVVAFSGHGSPGSLALKHPDTDWEALGARYLSQALAPLAGHDTVVILSACYSGSLIPALLAPHRVVMTAARRDRSSFGCEADANDTVYGEAAIRQFAEPGRALSAISQAIAADVAREERDRGYKPPSLPQIAAGPDSEALLDAPLF